QRGIANGRQRHRNRSRKAAYAPYAPSGCAHAVAGGKKPRWITSVAGAKAAGSCVKSMLEARRDLEFLLFEWWRVDELTKNPRFAEHSRETFADVLSLCEELATRYFASHNTKSDENEPSFDGTTVSVIPEVKQAVDAFAAADLIG